MPHGESWFSFLIFYENVQHAAQFLTGDEHTWLTHADISVHHVFGSLLVMLLLLVVGIFVYLRASNVRAVLVPDDRLSALTLAEIRVEQGHEPVIGGATGSSDTKFAD